jgi:predicted transcriptional regulator
MQHVTLRLPDDLHERVKAQAWRDRQSYNRWATYALLEQLDRKEQEAATDDNHA